MSTSNTNEIGLLLFTEHIFSFEVTAFILLVAIIAAIAINMSDRERALRQDPAKQILETKESRLKIIKDNEIWLLWHIILYLAHYFSHYSNDITGQVFVFFILAVAAAESAIGLAIIVSLFRARNSLEINLINKLKG